MILAMTRGTLHYLDFDFTEDELGHGSFDAMAAAAPTQVAALQEEIARVLDWAHRGFGEPGPLEEGGEWDFELQGLREVATTLQVRWQPGSGLALQPGATGEPRVTLSLTLTGTAMFCDALRAAFGTA
jgi:hypothetical protein